MSFECTAESPHEHILCEAMAIAATSEPAAASGALRNFFARVLGAAWAKIQEVVASGVVTPAAIIAALAGMGVTLPAWAVMLLPFIVSILTTAVPAK